MSRKYRCFDTAFTKDGVCVYVIKDDKEKGAALVRDTRGGDEYTVSNEGMLYTKDMESIDVYIQW